MHELDRGAPAQPEAEPAQPEAEPAHPEAAPRLLDADPRQPEAVPRQPEPTSTAPSSPEVVSAIAPTVPDRGKRIRRRVLRWTAAVAAVAVLIVGGSYAWVRIDAAGHQYSVAQAPSAPVALVLGAGLRADGSPSEYLRYRLDDAAALYRAGKVKVLLVSGDNGTTSHDEPNAMRDYLAAQGVPASKVVRDYAGFDTWDSCSRARRIFGADRILVVTQTFHLPRAVFLCRQAGLNADGVADNHPVQGIGNSVREIPGSVKAAWDAIVEPDPTFLGPQEPGVQRAIAGSPG